MKYYFSKILQTSFDAAVDPLASMQAVENPALVGIAQAVQQKLKTVVENL